MTEQREEIQTIVHVLRHGEVHNPEGVLYGRKPGYFLSDLGVKMAEAAAQSIAKRDVTKVISSPLERARQTAEPFAATFNVDIDIDDRLIESSNYFEGLRVGVGDGEFADLHADDAIEGVYRATVGPSGRSRRPWRPAPTVWPSRRRAAAR